MVKAKSGLGEAIRYALTRSDGLSRFLDDSFAGVSSNAPERSIRPLALDRNHAKRKNALFESYGAGGDICRTALRAIGPRVSSDPALIRRK